MAKRERILVTGSAGRVGRLLTPALRKEFRLRVLDLSPQRAEADDETVQGDVRDLELTAEACRDVAAVVHLAAQPADAEFRGSLLPRNLDGAWAIFEAAVSAHVPRLVFASSLQVLQGYPPDYIVPADAAPRPISTYACTKVFGEALARFHSDTSGLGAACLRIGAVRSSTAADVMTDDALHGIWCSSNDLASLVVAAIRSETAFSIVTAVSPPATRRFDVTNPFGWTPVELPGAAESRAD
jgi:UDP-glucose 4-epimerase